MSQTLARGFNVNAESLPDCHFIIHNAECGICKTAEEADPPASNANSSHISPKAIAKLRVCGHIFHELCLQVWLHTQVVNNNTSGTCPTCRAVLVPANYYNAQRQEYAHVLHRLAGMEERMAALQAQHQSALARRQAELQRLAALDASYAALVAYINELLSINSAG
jgi:hypothetical protein